MVLFCVYLLIIPECIFVLFIDFVDNCDFNIYIVFLYTLCTVN
jgi:hypothetical protein